MKSLFILLFFLIIIWITYNYSYNKYYSDKICLAKPHESLVDAELATKESNFLLDVHQDTLQHKKYHNIFGIGDINNIPTSKTFWGACHQIQVVRNNLVRAMEGIFISLIFQENILMLFMMDIPRVLLCLDKTV